MTREDRFLDVFGKIDDKYLVTALPGAFEPDLGTAVIHADKSIEAVEITEKDIRRYRILQAVKYSAAAAVVIAAGALLWANWDKIAVSGGKSSSPVTTQTNDVTEPGGAVAVTSDTVISLSPPIPMTTSTEGDTGDNSGNYDPFFNSTGDETETTDDNTLPENFSIADGRYETDISADIDFEGQLQDGRILFRWSRYTGGEYDVTVDGYTLICSENGTEYFDVGDFAADSKGCVVNLDGTEQFPLYFIIQCRFNYEGMAFLGYSAPFKIE